MNPIVKRILIIAAAALLLVYICFQGYKILVSPLDTETVKQATAYRTLETQGVVFRDETVISDAPSGYLFYSVENGNRVSRGGKIADVFATEADALAQQKLDQLDAEIASLSSINAQGTSNRANMKAIKQQIEDTWLQITQAAQSATFDEMEELHSRLQTLLNKEQITLGRVDSYDARIAEIKEERKRLAASFKPADSKVTAPVAGYFVSKPDGFETLVSTEEATTLDVAAVERLLTHQPSADAGGVGKVVGDYEWYLACVISLDEASEIKMGAQMEVRMPFVSSDVNVMQVVAINKDPSGKAALVLKCTNMNGALSTVRVEQIELRLKQYNGIRIPDVAIHFNEAREQGVYVQVGNVLQFRRIRALHHDTREEYTLCEIVDEKGYVKLYDKIVVKGEELYDGKLVR